MAHVVIPDQTPRIVYAVGSTPLATFPVPFAFFDGATDLAVYVGGVAATYSPAPVGSLQFSVAATGAADDGFSGGSITLGSTVTNTTVVIERVIPIDRTEDFPYPSSTLAIRALNRGLDRVAAWGQQVRRDIGRALRLPPFDPVPDLLLPAVAGRAGKIVGFASDGSLLLYTITGSTVSLYAQWAGTAGGTANARTLTPAPALGAYGAGVGLEFINGAAGNSGAATLNVSGLGAAAVLRPDGSALQAGDMPASSLLTVRHDGSAFRLVNLVPGVSAASETVAGVAEISTQAEADAGADDLRVITPLKLAARKAAPRTITGADTVVATDHRRLLLLNGTFTLATAAGLPAGFEVPVRNIGTGVVTIDPNGSEAIDGALTLLLPPRFGGTLLWTGTEWITTIPPDVHILSQLTPGGTSTVDFTLPSADILYRLRFTNLAPVNSEALLMRFGNPTFFAGASDYHRSGMYNGAATATGFGDLAGSSIVLTTSVPAGASINGFAEFYPGAAGAPAALLGGQDSGPEPTNTYLRSHAIHGRRAANGVATTVRLTVATGNFGAGGRVGLYGIRP